MNELMTTKSTETVNMIHETSEKEIVVNVSLQAKMEAQGFKVGKYEWKA